MFNLLALQRYSKNAYMHNIYIIMLITNILCSQSRNRPTQRQMRNVLKQSKIFAYEFDKTDIPHQKNNPIQKDLQIIISKEEQFEAIKKIAHYKILDRIFILFGHFKLISDYLNMIISNDRDLDIILRYILNHDPNDAERGILIQKLNKKYLKLNPIDEESASDEFVRILYTMVNFLASNYGSGNDCIFNSSEYPFMKLLFLFEYSYENPHNDNLFKKMEFTGKNDLFKLDFDDYILYGKPTENFNETMTKLYGTAETKPIFKFTTIPSYIILDTEYYFDFFMSNFSSKNKAMADRIYLGFVPFKIAAFIEKSKEMKFYIIQNDNIIIFDEGEQVTTNLTVFIFLKWQLFKRNKLIVILESL